MNERISFRFIITHWHTAHRTDYMFNHTHSDSLEGVL